MSGRAPSVLKGGVRRGEEWRVGGGEGMGRAGTGRGHGEARQRGETTRGEESVCSGVQRSARRFSLAPGRDGNRTRVEGTDGDCLEGASRERTTSSAPAGGLWSRRWQITPPWRSPCCVCAGLSAGLFSEDTLHPPCVHASVPPPRACQQANGYQCRAQSPHPKRPRHAAPNHALR